MITLSIAWRVLSGGFFYVIGMIQVDGGTVVLPNPTPEEAPGPHGPGARTALDDQQGPRKKLEAYVPTYWLSCLVPSAA